MKLGDTIQLALSNFKIHRKQNIILILALTTFSSLAFIINFWYTGLQNSYYASAGRSTNGEILLILSAENVDGSKTAHLEDIRQDVEKFHGKILSGIQQTDSYFVLPAEYLSPVIEVNLDTIPVNTQPVLAANYMAQQWLNKNYSQAPQTAEQKLQSYETFRSEVIGKTFTDHTGNKLQVVGLSPGSFGVSNLSFKNVARKNNNPLNAILERVPVQSSSRTFIIASVDNSNYATLPAFYARFTNICDFRSYIYNGQASFMAIDLPAKTYSAEVIAGLSAEGLLSLDLLKFFLTIISIFLIITAILIIIFTSVRLTSQDSNINLYYKLGATYRQVQSIYLTYFGTLILISILTAIIIASLAAITYSLLNQTLLSTIFMTAFNLSSTPQIILWGISPITILMIILLLLVAPLCTFVNRHTLKPHK